MSTMKAHEPGTFCWPELYTTDQVGAKAFYAKLFGWEIREIPMGPNAAYTIFTLNGEDAAACYGALPNMAERGIRPHWISYVSVASADETAAKTSAAGGAVLKEPFDVPATGRMAVLADPAGAVFCAWQGMGKNGVGVLKEPGALQWTELLTSDIEGSAAFYDRVFGWKRQLWPSPGEAVYHLFKNGDAMAGGMTPITPEMEAMKPTWVVYFNVESCDGTIARAHLLGGHVTMAPEKVENVGTFAFIADPAGAHFGILQPAKV
jgi:predicted enzyme related to lactoylglutathione lyase